MEKAYELAKKGGYEGRLYVKKVNSEWLDPLFWQALGKSLGWGKFSTDVTYPRTWKDHMHAFIDHLIDGETPESFFTTLI